MTFGNSLDDSIDSRMENIRIGLKQAPIRNTAYTFSEYNNRLYYSLNLDGAEEVKKMELPTGRVLKKLHRNRSKRFKVKAITSQWTLSRMNISYNLPAIQKKMNSG